MAPSSRRSPAPRASISSSPRAEHPTSTPSTPSTSSLSAFAGSQPNAHVPTHAHTLGRTRSAMASTMRSALAGDRLDIVQTLGGYTKVAESVGSACVGHRGCVNALCWNRSGELLASGSDDTTVVLWKVGTSHIHPSATAEEPSLGRRRRHWPADSEGSSATKTVAHYPPLDIGKSAVIHTGHTANIFSVAFAPGSNDTRLFTAAGDSQVRVFDLPRHANTSGPAPGASSAGLGAGHRASIGQKWFDCYDASHPGVDCRTLRCHRGMVKRLATENSPDILLSVAEDGDVRLHDLRTHHVCRSACPRPLLHSSTGLYSLTVSPLQPHLLAVAGIASVAYLYDRRMIGRALQDEWGVPTPPGEESLLARCVRKFGSHESRHDDGQHITAVKLSEKNGQDLLLTYSDGAIYRFSIHDEPGVVNYEHKRSTLSCGLAESASSFEDSTNNSDRETEGSAGSHCSQDGSGDEEAPDSLMADSEAEATESSSLSSGSPTEQEANDFPLFRQLVADGEAEDRSTSDGDDASSEGTDSLSDSDSDEDWSDDDSLESAPASQGPRQSLGKVPTVYPRRKYRGHVNVDTVKEINFLGVNDEYVVSGSDDGNLFIWDTASGKLKGIWKGDEDVVNVAVAHPTLPILAVSGIDSTVKIFGPWSRRWEEPDKPFAEATAPNAPAQPSRWLSEDRRSKALERNRPLEPTSVPDRDVEQRRQADFSALYELVMMNRVRLGGF